MIWGWPWVSKRAFREVREERDTLRERVEHLTDQLIRLTRVRNGRPEAIPERKNGEREPIPEGLREIIRGFESPRVRTKLMRQARRRQMQGDSWEAIRGELETQIEDGMIA